MIHVDDVALVKETREHLFFHCPDSVLIWKLAPVSWEGIQGYTDSLEEWWKRICMAKYDHQFQRRAELTVYLLWHMWKARCTWQFEGRK